MRRTWLAVILILLVGAVFSEARAQRAVRFFESLRHTKGQFFGLPFTLLPWQRRIITDVYGMLTDTGRRQVKYAYVELPKKNGKSELAAGAGLYHTFADGEKNGEVYGCAADRSQASIVFDVAVDMVDQLPALKKRTKLQLSRKRMVDKVSGTFYQVLSAEAFTKHGLNVSAVVFDELHAQPNRDLWDVMTFGAGDARLQPMWWIITTAGDDPDRVSIGWEQHDYAARLLAGDIYDPTWYPVIYGYEGDDIYNEANWASSNPSLGETIKIESLREAAERAKAKPADERLFRWLRLNQWITTRLSNWLPVEIFDQSVGDWDRLSLMGRDCYMGLDLSSTTDLTAICLVFPPQKEQRDWRVIWDVFIPAENMAERIKNDKVPYDQWLARNWITATEGNVIDYTKIEDRILELCKIYNVVELDADRALATMLLQRLEAKHLTCVDIPQTYLSLSDPLTVTEVLLKGNAPKESPPAPLDEGEVDLTPRPENAPALVKGTLLGGWMTHEANPVARWCFGNTAVAKNGQGYQKFVKEHKGKSVSRTKRIDTTAAWINAMARARFYTGSVDLSAEILSDDWGM